MKTLLIAINSKYIHSNLGIYYLQAYADKYKDNIKVLEYTINQYQEDILQSIYLEKPDLISISCYIWNIEMVSSLCREFRKVLPNTKIWLGGPEVTYESKKYLLNHPEVDGIMLGEGEETFLEILDYYNKKEDSISLESIKSITYRKSAEKEFTYEGYNNFNDYKKQNSKGLNNIIQTEIRPLLDFNTVPFPYDDLTHFENKIIYYESSRGCPFSCSYCLSSVDKKMRLRDINLVKEELNFFLKHKVKQVKFVDRTFNCNKAHSLAIWKHLKENDNSITNFHFEIAADLLDDEEIQLLKSMRDGLVQLEIGVQSTNPKTIKAINRKTNFNKISKNVINLSENRNVHQHLDLIAGLPYEDYESFKNSFNEVYNLKPDQLQLGFLKVLKGAPIFEDSEEYGIVYKDLPPYEVLFTNWLSYDDILKLKLVEEMVEVYYNSGQFNTTIKFMEHYFETYFDLYKELGEYYRGHDLLDIRHTRLRRYEILIGFMESRLDELDGFKEILLYDLYLRENLKKRPAYASDKEKYKNLYGQIYSDPKLREKYLGIEEVSFGLGKAKQYFHIEHFNIDVEKSAKEGKYINDPQIILFNYKDRDPIDNNASRKIINEGDLDL